jgi:hypothetical protein
VKTLEEVLDKVKTFSKTSVGTTNDFTRGYEDALNDLRRILVDSKTNLD